MYFSKSDLEQSSKVKRLNIINSVSGIKPANLIGTEATDGVANLAIFSSIVHMSSSPASLGFIIRPDSEVRRHTYENIQANGCFTVNHIHSNFIEKAHYTSAKFEAEVSEFDRCELTKEYLFDFKAPFVKESNLKIALKHLESIPIKSANTILVVGEIQHLVIADHAIDQRGYIDLGLLENVGISGLNCYYELNKINEFPYARPQEVPNWNQDKDAR
ncbi:MAG: flavin reductase (DIM6/NTAB) family NADH-FMN oxidoreductase RutF [Arenicella sp.]|jgi:flavin reductase (DIM6/NTAB) family NADH-FMN oxidoreductase RutF